MSGDILVAITEGVVLLLGSRLATHGPKKTFSSCLVWSLQCSKIQCNEVFYNIIGLIFGVLHQVCTCFFKISYLGPEVIWICKPLISSKFFIYRREGCSDMSQTTYSRLNNGSTHGIQVYNGYHNFSVNHTHVVYSHTIRYFPILYSCIYPLSTLFSHFLIVELDICHIWHIKFTWHPFKCLERNDTATSYIFEIPNEV